MAQIDLIMPKMGESVAEATIIRWLKNEGDKIDLDESVLEIATDKVDSDVPSPVAGILVKKLFGEDDIVKVGAVIAIIENEVLHENTAGKNGVEHVAAGLQPNIPVAAAAAEKPAMSEKAAMPEIPAAVHESGADDTTYGIDLAGLEYLTQLGQAVSVNGGAQFPVDGSERFYSPLVKSIAQSEGVTRAELDHLPGSGAEGRVTKSDILTYVENRIRPGYSVQVNGQAQQASPGITPATTYAAAPVVAPVAPVVAPVAPAVASVVPAVASVAAPANTHSVPPVAVHAPVPAIPESAEAPSGKDRQAEPEPKSLANYNFQEGDEIIQMDRMRRLIADHMISSKEISAHVTSFVEADVTNMVLWRDKIKDDFKKRENEGITFTPIFIEAVAKALKEFPMVNVSVFDKQIIVHKHIHIGMAAALPSGNLIVPVIRDADQKNLFGLTKSVNDLANRARLNKLLPGEVSGGTFTLTNVGSFGNIMGTPIINQPQVAILAVGAIKKKPAVITTEMGDVIAIRHLMYLSLSYDHRVVDGAMGGRFLRRVADHLEGFDVKREI